MIKLKLLLYIFSLFLLGAIKAQNCKGRFEALAYKNDTIIVKCKELVLMNTETYAEYYYKEYELNELKNIIPDYKSKIDSIESELRRKGERYVAIINKQDSLVSIVDSDRLQLRGLLEDCSNNYLKEKSKSNYYKKRLGRSRFIQYILVTGIVIILII